MRVGKLGPLVLLAISCNGSPATGSPCGGPASGSWELTMKADSSAYTVNGTVSLDTIGGKVDLVATSADGGRERMRYPTRNLQFKGDSLRFDFAPLGFDLRGKCTEPKRFTGAFAVPQAPPFDSLRGSWTMTRR